MNIILRFAIPALIGVLSLTTAPAAQAKEGELTGDWIFEANPPYPGLRMLEVKRANGKLEATLTTDWYGPMALGNPEEKDGVLSFDVHNGNPRLPVKRWTAQRVGANLKVTGEIWYAKIEAQAHAGTKAEVAQRIFNLTTLPPAAKVPVDGLAKTPPMGWNSWNKFEVKSDDAIVRGIADAMVSSGLRDAGYIYVNLDDGWQGQRDDKGNIRPNAHFPDMKALADYLHARGLKFGIYSSPGPKTCAGYEGSYGHIEQDAATYASWGVDYLKYDLCSGEYFYRTREEIQRTYQQMGAALKATGRPIIYSLCEYGREDVGSWGRDVGGHLWRTTGDITDSYKDMSKNGFDGHNGKPEYAGPGGWNDPDMLEVGNGAMSNDEYRTHMTLWAMSAAPLILGNDVRSMTPETVALLTNREVIAVDQDALGKQGFAVQKK